MALWNTTTLNVTPPSPPSNCTVDTSYRFTFYQVSYTLIFLVGVVTNGLALRRRCVSPATVSSTGVYLLSLSAADVCFVISLPLRVYYYHQKAQRTGEPAWSPGAAYCQVTFTLKYISLYGAIFFLVCIALDRYLAVVHPLASAHRRLRVAQVLSGGIWCVVLGLSVTLPLMASHPQQLCLPDPSSPRHRPAILAALGLVLGAFLLPAALLVYCYCRVVSVLRQPRHRQRRNRRRTLTVIYWVLGVFLLCFGPYHLNLLGYTLTNLGLVASCGLAKVTALLHPVVLSLASSNCCLNPFIYYISSNLGHREGPGSGASGSR